jgi:hypothetical protein
MNAVKYGQLLILLELVVVCRAPENGDERVGIKLDDHTLEVGIICKFVLPAHFPVLLRKFRTPSIPGNNIYDTFPTGTWPDTTELLDVRLVVKRRGACIYE